MTLGEDVFYVSECKGEGGFAKVFAASKQETEGDSLCSLNWTQTFELRMTQIKRIDENYHHEN